MQYLQTPRTHMIRRPRRVRLVALRLAAVWARRRHLVRLVAVCLVRLVALRLAAVWARRRHLVRLVAVCLVGFLLPVASPWFVRMQLLHQPCP